MDIINFLIILFVGIFGSSFGTLIGGGSLITIPTLIFLGLPPHTAIGTNRFGTGGVTSAGWYKFHRKKKINYKIGLIIGIPFFFASILGANLVLKINENIIEPMIASITLLILVFMMFRPKMGIEKTKLSIRKYEYIIAMVFSFIIGIYAGFYGAASGTFLTYLLILVLGQTFLESAGTRKIAYVFSTIITVAIFAINGKIYYPLGIAMFIGSFIGSYLGAHYSDKIGNVWVRRMFFILVFIMVIKLLI